MINVLIACEESQIECLAFRSLGFNAYCCEHVAIENPKPWGKSGLPKHDDYIEPYMFGDSYSKRTYFWLKGLPPLYPTLHCLDYVSYVGSVSGSKKRSKSFYGIAQAMADQWGNFVYDFKTTNKKDF